MYYTCTEEQAKKHYHAYVADIFDCHTQNNYNNEH